MMKMFEIRQGLRSCLQVANTLKLVSESFNKQFSGNFFFGTDHLFGSIPGIKWISQKFEENIPVVFGTRFKGNEIHS